MCVIINPDIVVASEISEIWASIGHHEKDLHKKIKILTESKISFKKCFQRQVEAKEEAGIGNMIAESLEEHYRIFMENNDTLFVWAGQDNYQIRHDCKLLPLLSDDIQKEQWDIKDFFRQFVKTSYDHDTLIAFNII